MIRKRWRIELSKYQALAKKRDFWRRLAVKALVLDLCLVAVTAFGETMLIPESVNSIY